MTSVNLQEIERLFWRSTSASLASLDHQTQTPYASLINVCVDRIGPILLLSDLAWHTKNLKQNQNASLLVSHTVASDREVDPLQALRVTILGTFKIVEDEVTRQTYLQKHPSAKMFSNFKDFSYWRLEPKTIHAIAGFGAISTYDSNLIFDTEKL